MSKKPEVTLSSEQKVNKLKKKYRAYKIIFRHFTFGQWLTFVLTVVLLTVALTYLTYPGIVFINDQINDFTEKYNQIIADAAASGTPWDPTQSCPSVPSGDPHYDVCVGFNTLKDILNTLKDVKGYAIDAQKYLRWISVGVVGVAFIWLVALISVWIKFRGKVRHAKKLFITAKNDHTLDIEIKKLWDIKDENGTVQAKETYTLETAIPVSNVDAIKPVIENPAPVAKAKAVSVDPVKKDSANK